MKQILTRLGLGLISLGVPFFLLITSIRLVIAPWAPPVEYRMPYFPPDPYGFTLEDRLKWSRISLDYLYNDAGIDFLANQRLPDGNPLYNERELSHMRDVKALFQQMIRAWIILLVLYILVIVWAWRSKWLAKLWGAFANGGKLTITLILCILALVAVSFNWLFTEFHRLFFTGDTWLFLYSDSLIRLFPIPLWRDSFILVGLITIGAAVLLIVFGSRFSRQTENVHRDESQPLS